jgi:hypothetical protein
VTSIKIARDVRSFVGIAAFTTQSEIVSYGQAAVFFSDDVIDLKGEQGNLCRNLTILATLRGPLPDTLPQFSIHDVRL